MTKTLINVPAHIPVSLMLYSVVFMSFNIRVERIYEDVRESIVNKSIHNNFQLEKLPLVIQKVTALMGVLVCIAWFQL